MSSAKLNPIWEFLKSNNIETVSHLPSNLLCVLCNKILINARQTPCGCRFCDDCIVEEFRNESKKCPGGTEDCSDQVLNFYVDIIGDNNANREISKLIVRCPNNQCFYEEELRRLPEHVKICEYEQKSCDKCHQKVLKKDIETHSLNYCEWRDVLCKFCAGHFTFKELHSTHNNVQHELLCDKYNAVCPNQCGIIQSVLIKPHLENCSNKPEPCPYAIIGCALVNIPRQLVNQHLLSESHSHAKSLVNYIGNLNNEITSLKLANITQTNYIEELEKTIKFKDIFELRHNDFIWKIENYNQILTLAENRRTLYVESKPFLSDRYGYKMRLKLFPNGDSDGCGTYLSLYFIILRGKYDDLLEWPFKRTVTLTLLNCSGKKDYIKSGEFTTLSRTSPEQHTEAGSTKFFEIARLAELGFLKDDNLYLKCTIN